MSTLVGPGITPGRYSESEDGSIFDSWGGYWISLDLWKRRLAEGRSDTAEHNFRYLDMDPRPEGMGYFTQTVECSRCGERRNIGCSVAELNRIERWCIPPARQPGLFDRLFRGLR